MDVRELARTAIKRRQGRAGRRFKGTEAIARELDSAGKPAGQGRAFEYPSGVKAAERLLELCNEAQVS